jgi:hypothetical protein
VIYLKVLSLLGGSTAEKFNIKYRYLKSDERIGNKAKKSKKNSSARKNDFY